MVRAYIDIEEHFPKMSVLHCTVEIRCDTEKLVRMLWISYCSPSWKTIGNAKLIFLDTGNCLFANAHI